MDVKTAQHPNIQANAMAVDFDGRYSVLGTRRNIILIDLNNPQEVARRLNRQSKWDISHVQWNPCFTKKQHFVATYSQWADLWTWDEGAGSLLATLRGHTRVISDVDWCPCDDNLLATCSIDTYIYVWDIRDTKRPKMTPSAVAGASQVKWNKFAPNVLATSHDGDIRIWDIRNGRTPMQYITAHLSKIHSLDWSPVEQDILASSGQDTTVRFWDTTQQSLQASYQISAGAPVWKARYTPFGYGMVTALMSQIHRWDNSILLWNVQNVSSIVHSFVGHRDVILDFGWRYNQEDTCAELVTWSKDHSLRLWRADSSLLHQCGCGDNLQDEQLDVEDEVYDINVTAADDEGLQMSLDNNSGLMQSPPSFGSEYSVSRKSNEMAKNMLTPRSGSGSFRPQDLFLERASPRYSTSPTYPVIPSPLTQSTTPIGSLEQEFKLMNIDLQNLYIEELDPIHRTCAVLVQSNYIVVKVLCQFPSQYPNNVSPTFHFLKPTNMSPSAVMKLSNMLRETAQNHVRSNLTCIEPCLRMLSSQVENMSHSEINNQDIFPPYSNMKSQSGYDRMFGTYQHLVNIPFPRTSGARFCGAGHLVTFMRPTQVKGFEASSKPAPRCLATLITFRNNNMVQKQLKVGRPISAVQHITQYATSPTENSDISVKSFYYKEKKPRKSWKHHVKESVGSSSDPASSSDKLQMRLHKAAGKVVIQDLSTVLTLNKKLAEEYVVPTKYDYMQTCQKNREAADRLGRKDLVELWSSLELIQSSVLQDKSKLSSDYRPWASTSFGKGLLSSLIDHYSQLLDVQTLAMISCMFVENSEIKQDRYQIPHNNTVPLFRTGSFSSFENESSNGSHRSNSFCENPADPWWMKAGPSPTSNLPNYLDSPPDSDYRYIESPVVDHELNEHDNHEKLKQLLDFSKESQYDAFKQAYADILDRWGLLNQRTEILKYKSQPAPAHTGLVFMISCQYCESETQSPQCTYCRKFAMNCSLCQLPVKNLMSFCYLCGHGGHTDHMESWFQSSMSCATGCGCECRPRQDRTIL
ncbi:GATOR2 complex protein WDR59-like [Styela clava]